MKADAQGGGFQVRSSLGPPGPVSKDHCVFNIYLCLSEGLINPGRPQTHHATEDHQLLRDPCLRLLKVGVMGICYPAQFHTLLEIDPWLMYTRRAIYQPDLPYAICSA